MKLLSTCDTGTKTAEMGPGGGGTAARLHSPCPRAGGWCDGFSAQTGGGRRPGAVAATRAQAGSLGPSLTSLHPRPAHFILFHRNRSAGQRSCHFLAALTERSELATDGGGSKARFPGPAAARQLCSPCSTRRTHFPRWLGSAAESVGISGEGGMRLPPSPGENHSTVKDALHPCPSVIVEEVFAALGKSRPLSHLTPHRTSPANSGGKMLEEAEGGYSSLWSDKG